MNFKVGMHVTHTNSDGYKLHGVVDKIREEYDNMCPIEVNFEKYGKIRFTLEGRRLLANPITLKIRDEL